MSMRAKADDAWDIIKRIIDDPPEKWDFGSDKEKWEWIAKRYAELHDAQNRMSQD